ncbi:MULTISPECIES: SMI1/KNR4 family protein [unclassified Streptomyces]|uniref:SMI1/KNR4 family protein n=1 Tax=unclassified Streptomyces TaxID=2593676 RepID=UPI00225A8634|nr:MULTISPECIES: SMI1/KNR4 family protein [unclassified Streptomyces]WSP60384.1 SMI1/KNR4 family protein [Streptomyces sp. NBC_01241]WSU26750.1 SMI1/KNR4 family protein [Streptomyces sp. NBC_01108]MCX4790028.1 SMI1/KNR4 family protein [Streptomyces sp. NBC_01221]MCX4794246.1 SMI1/KNR4 family protein [Streptomyces sp. NBC_01242]WSJ41340.1 SMI1/KNR4 family protein [Streptomyces sp. NBC_01321]
MRELVGQVMATLVKAYFADSPMGAGSRPAIRPPAEPGALAELERHAGQSLEAGYRQFLLLTDGLEGFPLVLLGCQDWEPGGLGEAAEEFRETVLDSDPEDVGVSPETPCFPVAVNADRSQGIFLIDTVGPAEERFWWTGEGDSFYFVGFADVLAFLNDAGSCDPRESLCT